MHRVKNSQFSKFSKTSLPWLHFKTQALHREENKVEFLEEQFHNEKLSFAHKKKIKLSFEFSP